MKKEYDIVTGRLTVIVEAVNNAHKRGWKSEGGLAVCLAATKNSSTIFSQVIVREKATIENDTDAYVNGTEGAEEQVDKFSFTENEKKTRRLEKQVKKLQEENMAQLLSVPTHSALEEQVKKLQEENSLLHAENGVKLERIEALLLTMHDMAVDIKTSYS